MASGSEEPVPITSQKHDPAWKHCQMFRNGERAHLKCVYCGKLFKGGGIHRIKEHLAGQKGNASTCVSVPSDVRALMQQSLDGVVLKKRNRQKLDEEIGNINPTPRGEDETRKRGRAKKVDDVVNTAIGRFLYDIGASMDAVHSPYFRPMIEAIASGGFGVSLPSYHDLRGSILKSSVEEIRSEVEKHRTGWERTGCSILVDELNTETGRVFLSFSVNSPEGTVFLETVDASNVVNSADAIYELFRRIVEEVGAKNVVQVITSSDKEEYIVAAKRLVETFRSLYWSPCVARSIDSILEDFGNIDWISKVIEQARSITRFVYNHAEVLNMVRRYTFGNDFVEPGITVFSTNFTTLKRLVEFKHNLHTMVTSKEWVDCASSKKQSGVEMLDSISSQSFWSSCILIVNLTSSLLRVLRLINGKKRPAMGYIYAAMYRVKETIKKELVKKDDYTVYWDIIDRRWERHRSYPLHTAGFFLNPKFFYGIEGDIHNGLSGMFDCIERLIPDTKIQDKIIQEINSYKNAAGDFGRKMAIRTRDTLLPAEWWSFYGSGCQNLTRLAIRILSQTCNLAEYTKWNRDCVRKMHDSANSIEKRRLSDLIFVQYNLKLRKMIEKSDGRDSPDAISSNNVNVAEEWFRRKEDDVEYSDWTEVDPPLSSTMLRGIGDDDPDDLGTGFEDNEILCRVKDGEKDDNEDNVE